MKQENGYTGDETKLVSVHYKIPEDYREKVNRLAAELSARRGRFISASELIRLSLKNLFEKSGYL